MTAVRVIGAGLSGLAAAWRLVETGAQVDVFDSATDVGGLVGTTQTPWGPAEHAANAFVWTERTEEWFRRLDIPPVFALDTSRRRFIYRNGRPRRWPLSAGETIATVARVGTAVVTRRMSARDRETVEDWGRRVVGHAATKHLLAPALQGIYAAPLDQLAARAVFGHKKRGRTRMAAPAGGMGQFTRRLREVLELRGVRIHINRPITALDPEIPTWVCTNAPTAARLLQPYAPEAAALVGRVRIAALASVTAFFTPHPGDVHGFGILFPRDAGIRALGVLMNTDIFPGRGPHRSETWIYGGATTDALPPEAELRALVREDRQTLTGRLQDPVGTHVAYWPAAFPIYDQAIVDLADIHRHLPPWLHVAGNYLGKRGVSDLI